MINIDEDAHEMSMDLGRCRRLGGQVPGDQPMGLRADVRLTCGGRLLQLQGQREARWR